MKENKIYRIKAVENYRVMSNVKTTSRGYTKDVCIGEKGLEEFAKTNNIAEVRRDSNGHIISYAQKEHIMNGGFEGCFFEFFVEEV